MFIIKPKKVILPSTPGYHQQCVKTLYMQDWPPRAGSWLSHSKCLVGHSGARCCDAGDQTCAKDFQGIMVNTWDLQAYVLMKQKMHHSEWLIVAMC